MLNVFALHFLHKLEKQLSRICFPGPGEICRQYCQCLQFNIYAPEETGALLLARKSQEEHNAKKYCIIYALNKEGNPRRPLILLTI
jgi:hypothetical protein